MRKPLTKTQLMALLAEKTGMSKKDISEQWDKIVAVFYDEAREAGAVTLPGLGKLVKQHRKARMGRNPATGEEIQIPAKTVCKFRVAKATKDAVLD
ncbi:MAG: HU family DNA-binding protein [Candidatus Kerfeldbacteria bacterium]